VRAEFAGQFEEPLRHRGRPQPGQVPQAGGVGDDARGESEPCGAGDQPGVALDAQPQPVLGDQPSGERVVGEDQFLAGLGVGGEYPGPVQRLPHAAAQLAGGLAGEGQTEHLFGQHLAGPDEPHHPRGHHRRLAGPGAGDDHCRFQRRGDRCELLPGEVDVEDAAELCRFREPHRSTCPPRPDAGQLFANGHVRQWGPGVAG
jgi:hypothetical protein